MSRLFTKCGTLGKAGLSRPSNVACTAPWRTPAVARMSLSLAPTHSAFPMAPSPHSPPRTRGANRPRLLPEHWVTAVTAAFANLLLRSSRDSSSGRSTSPLTRKRQVPRSTLVGTGKVW